MSEIPVCAVTQACDVRHLRRHAALLALPSLLALALSRPSYAETPRASRNELRVLETAHFRISYNAGEVFVRKRAELFEELYTKLTEFFAADGISIVAPRRRMEVLLFATRGEFDAHRRGAPLHLPQTDGYYSWKERRTVFFNKLEDPVYAADMSELAVHERHLGQLRAQLGTMTGNDVIVTYTDGRTRTMTKGQLQSAIAAEAAEVQRERIRVFGRYDRFNESTTLHEGTHQLVHNLAILPMEDSPLWLIEGIAMFFEAALFGDLREARTVNRDRFIEYREAQLAKRLFPLKSLLTDDRNLSGTSAATGYPEAWALAHYLFHEHRDGMKRYIGRLRAAGSGGGAERRLADFKAAFGDLAAIEALWTAYMMELH
jgi:hypothetical protein